MIDIVLLSNAKTDELYNLTVSTIKNLRESGDGFNICIAEQNKEVKYDVNTFYMDADFNYNRNVNEVLKQLRNEYVCWCNNDVTFTKGWADVLISEMEKYGADSCSPMCPDTQGYKMLPRAWAGYQVTKQLNGWCLFAKRETLNKIGWLNEEFPFWFADNIYGWQLEQMNLKHYLFSRSIVFHHNYKRKEGATFNTVPRLEQERLKYENYNYYMEYYKPKMTYEMAVNIINTNTDYRFNEAVEFMRQKTFKEKMRVLDCKNEIMDVLEKYGCKLNGGLEIPKEVLKGHIDNSEGDVISLKVSENNFEVNLNE